MKRLKYILILLAWIAASFPCAHAVAVSGHMHEHAEQNALCTSADHHCHCHSCEDAPCSDKRVELVQRLAGYGSFSTRPVCCTLFILDEFRCTRLTVPPERTGILTALQTVRLLT